VIVTLEIKHALRNNTVLQITHLDPLHASVKMETKLRALSKVKVYKVIAN